MRIELGDPVEEFEANPALLQHEIQRRNHDIAHRTLHFPEEMPFVPHAQQQEGAQRRAGGKTPDPLIAAAAIAKHIIIGRCDDRPVHKRVGILAGVAGTRPFFSDRHCIHMKPFAQLINIKRIIAFLQHIILDDAVDECLHQIGAQQKPANTGFRCSVRRQNGNRFAMLFNQAKHIAQHHFLNGIFHRMLDAIDNAAKQPAQYLVRFEKHAMAVRSAVVSRGMGRGRKVHQELHHPVNHLPDVWNLEIFAWNLVIWREIQQPGLVWRVGIAVIDEAYGVLRAECVPHSLVRVAVRATKCIIGAAQKIEGLVIKSAKNVQPMLIYAVRIAFAHVMARGAFAAEPPAVLIDSYLIFVRPARLLGYVKCSRQGAQSSPKDCNALFLWCTHE